MPCNSGDDLTWPPVKEVVDAIDDAAEDLQTPNYEKLVDHERMPFKFDNKFDNITLYQSFKLNPHSDVIHERYISGSSFSTSDFVFPDPVLEKMAEDERLRFVHVKDDCLCTTGFKIVKDDDTSRFSLATLDVTGCCASLDVPENGDTLPTQGLIPAGPFSSYVAGGNPDDSTDQREGPQCKEQADGVYYKFTSFDAGSPLDYVQTKMEGYITWEADKCYFETMLMRWLQILRCDGNGGAKEFGGVLNEAYMTPPGYYIWPALYADQMVAKSFMTDDPGCMADSGDPDDRVQYHGMGAEEGGYTIPKAPWRENTCSGEDCDGNSGPKFYCETLKNWKMMAEKAKEVFRPFSDEQTSCRCSGSVIYTSTGGGTGTMCAGLRTGPFGSPVECDCIETENTITCVDVSTYDPENPDDTERYTKSSTHSKSGSYLDSTESCVEDCEGDACAGCDLEPDGQPLDYVESITRTCNDTASFSLNSCMSVANEEAGSSGSVRSRSAGGEDDCWPAYCAVGRGTFRVWIEAREDADGEIDNGCFGSDNAPETVEADILIYSGSEGAGDYVEVERTLTCSFAEDGWYSLEQDYPSEPHAISKSNNSFFWNVSVEEVRGCIKCTPLTEYPDGCAPPP